jgi:hypothetical protein
MEDLQKKDTVEFKNFQELDAKTFNALPVFNKEHAILIQKRITGSGYEVYSVQVKLHPQLVIVIPINADRYNAMLLGLKLPLYDEKGKEKLEHYQPARYRFVKGTNKVGEYKQLEIIFNKRFYNTWFLSNNPDQLFVFDKLEAAKAFDFPIDWVVRPGVLDNTDNPKFDMQ